MAKLSTFPVNRYYTDDLQNYRKHIPALEHLVGKADSWRIERRNLNFRTHIKRLYLFFEKCKKSQQDNWGVHQPLLFSERTILEKHLINGFDPAPNYVAPARSGLLHPLQLHVPLKNIVQLALPTFTIFLANSTTS